MLEKFISIFLRSSPDRHFADTPHEALWKVVCASLHNRPEEWKRDGNHHIKHVNGFLIWSSNEAYGLCGGLNLKITNHKEPEHVPPDSLREELWRGVEGILHPELREAEDRLLTKIEIAISSFDVPKGGPGCQLITE